MYNHLLFLGYFIVNALILISASNLLAHEIVLGSERFNEFESAVYASFWATFIVWVLWDFSIGRSFKISSKWGSFIFFFVVNFFAFWAVSVFHNSIGFKQESTTWLLGISAIATFLQAVIRKFIVRKSVYRSWF